MRLPTWEELESDPEQADVLEHPLNEPLFVVGPPGSGKTKLAVRRAQMATESEQGTATITYNRMLRRLMSLLDERDRAPAGIVVETMHSYIWQDYRARTGSSPPTLDHDGYAHDWETMLRCLEQRGVVPDRDHLVVDEGQDLAEGFFRYASRHIAKTLSVFADENQALAEQRTTLEQIKRAANLPDPVLLTHNHRTTVEIARLAEHFHTGRLPAVTAVRGRQGELPRFVQEPSLDGIARRISIWIETFGDSVCVIVDQNRTGERLQEMLRRALPESRVDLYTSRLKNEDHVDVFEDGVTILNKASVKGQEFDTVFILELQRFLPCRTDAMRRAMYMMCSRARDHLWLVCGPDGHLTREASHTLPGPEILERL